MDDLKLYGKNEREQNSLIKTVMKEKEYLRRVRKLFKSKLYSKYMIDRINAWAVRVI